MTARPVGSDEVTVAKQDTLHDAVRSLVDRGVTDPVTIVARLSEEYGQPWLLRQLVNIVKMITLGTLSGGAPREGHHNVSPVVTSGLPRVQRAAGGEFFDEMRWVSSVSGWKRVADLSAQDCLTIADQYRRLMDIAGAHSDWFFDAAQTMTREGAGRLADVRGLLQLPTARPLMLEEGDAA